jgi:hypothetical protein
MGSNYNKTRGSLLGQGKTRQVIYREEPVKFNMPHRNWQIIKIVMESGVHLNNT